MQQGARSRFIPLVLSVGLLVGCASTTSSNYPVDGNSRFSNFLVAAVADDYTNRSYYERTVASGLRTQGVSATPYYEAIGGNQPVTREAVRDLVATHGYDGVLVTRVLTSRSQVEAAQGSTAARVTRRSGRPLDFFRYDYEELDEPGSFEIRTEATLATELYRVSDEQQVWSMEMETPNADTVWEIIDDVSEKVVRRLERDRHIAP